MITRVYIKFAHGTASENMISGSKLEISCRVLTKAINLPHRQRIISLGFHVLTDPL